MNPIQDAQQALIDHKHGVAWSPLEWAKLVSRLLIYIRQLEKNK